jgi:hypothetical protein
LDQTRFTAKTEDHEYVDSKVAKLLSRVYAFYVQKKDMQSWIVLLWLFTLEHALLDMWSYKMW